MILRVTNKSRPCWCFLLFHVVSTVVPWWYSAGAWAGLSGPRQLRSHFWHLGEMPGGLSAAGAVNWNTFTWPFQPGSWTDSFLCGPSVLTPTVSVLISKVITAWPFMTQLQKAHKSPLWWSMVLVCLVPRSFLGDLQCQNWDSSGKPRTVVTLVPYCLYQTKGS